MTIRAREAVATKFLRDTLTGDAVGVRQLEALARARGLLGERQHITHAKVFRRAKDALGIQSVREGFGAGGRWAWKPPRSSGAPATISATIQQRSAPGTAIPREWVQGVARLKEDRPPPDIPRHRWTQLLKDCHAFLNSPEAERAARLDWRTTELFGCKPKYPLSYLGEAGLLWHVNGGSIVQLHRDWAVIDLQVNRSQRIFSRRDIDNGRVVLPWTLPLVKTE
jgi:hypothetical protein